MNPDPAAVAIYASIHDAQREQRRANQARLHKAAKERRAKAKRGGKR